jgi:hypothetical protein
MFIHESMILIYIWNLEPFKKFKFLNEIPFKKCVFLHLFSNKCVIISFFRKKPILYQRGGNFIDGHCIFFSLFLFGNVSWIPKWGLMAIEKMLHISYTLILSNLLHLTIGSKLVLIQNELWVPKCRHANFLILFLFFFVFKIAKGCHQNFSLLCTTIFVIHHFFWWKLVHPLCVFTFHQYCPLCVSDMGK